jgi:Transposase DDE domain
MKLLSFNDLFADWFQPERCLHWAKLVGWYKRKGKIHPFEFLISLVFGQLSATERTLAAQAHSLTEPVSRQAVDQRYSPAAVAYFQSAFQQTLHASLDWQPASLRAQQLQEHFSALILCDSTVLACDPSLAAQFPGCGGGGSAASLKVLLCYDYLQGRLHVLDLLPGKCSDQGKAQRVVQAIPRQGLGLLDAGFYNGAALQGLQERGSFFVIPWPHAVSVWAPAGQGQCERVDVAARLRATTDTVVELSPVRLGTDQAGQLHAVRLVAYRLKEERANRRRAALREKYRTQGRTPTAEALELAGWLILITNAPAQKLPARVLGFLYRVRWQIELVFKQFKSVLGLDTSDTGDEHRLQCEVWARLLCGLLLLVWHSYANAACWLMHRREISFLKMAKRLQQEGRLLAQALAAGGSRLAETLVDLGRKIMKLARKEHQQSRKTTWQNLQEHWLDLNPNLQQTVPPKAPAQA